MKTCHHRRGWWMFMVGMLLVASPTVLGWDHKDPFHNKFFHLLLKTLVLIEQGNDAEIQMALKDLEYDLEVCSLKSRDSRDGLVAQVQQILQEPKNERLYLKNIILLVRGVKQLTNGNWEEGKNTILSISQKAEQQERFRQILELVLWDIYSEEQYRAIMLLLESLLKVMPELDNKMPDVKQHRTIMLLLESLLKIMPTLDDKMPDVSLNEYLADAYFFLGKLTQYLKLIPNNELSSLKVTAALRLGKVKLANQYQEELDAKLPVNETKLLFLSSKSQRDELCRQLIQENYTTDQDSNNEVEGINPDLTLSNWYFLLCGYFDDAIRSGHKYKWSLRQTTCEERAIGGGWLMSRYNNSLAYAYLATQNRQKNQSEQATRYLEKSINETRRALYIDSFTGYSTLPVIAEIDIHIYMAKLHGWTPEIRVILGLLEKARGRYTAAHEAWKRARDENPGLSPAWQQRLKEWIEEMD